jgi:hypothetical protein
MRYRGPPDPGQHAHDHLRTITRPARERISPPRQPQLPRWFTPAVNINPLPDAPRAPFPYLSIHASIREKQGWSRL